MLEEVVSSKILPFIATVLSPDTHTFYTHTLFARIADKFISLLVAAD